MEWIADNPWAVWLALAVLLAVIEMFSLDFVLIMFAVGAGVAAIVAGAGGAVWLALAVFTVVSLALLVVARPPLVARMHSGPTLLQGPENQVGSTAVALSDIDHSDGRIKLAGETWSARTDRPASFARGEEVLVVRIEGATAIVAAPTNLEV